MKHAREPAARARPPSGEVVRCGVRFDARERRFLLRQRGIAEGVLAGIEAMGICSLDELVATGADELCRRMQAVHGRDVWGNRRRMLHAAIEAAASREGVVGGAGRAPSDAGSVALQSWSL